MSISPADHFWTLSLWLGLLTLCVTLVFLFILFVLKIIAQRQQDRAHDFVQVWQPHLMRIALTEQTSVPHPELMPRDAWRLIKLWVHFQMTLQGQASERLCAAGYAWGLDRLALRLAQSKHRSEQIFGILALGYLRATSAWDVLHLRLHQASDSTAMYAGWAMLRIAPDKAAPSILAQWIKRQDIDIMRLASLFKPFRSSLHGVLQAHIEAHVPRLRQSPQDDRDMAWLLKIAHALRLQANAATWLPMLAPDQHMDVIMGAMRLLITADGLNAVRALRTHPDWQVRTQVAIALGRLGQATDLEHLTILLTDAQWWVRYRAAQALAKSPFISGATLQEMIARVPDRYAQDMLKQVFAEIQSPTK